jgi:hypothetical protein
MMGQPNQRPRNPLTWIVAGILLLIAVFGAFWVPIYARTTPKLGDFPFFYWYQLIWMFVVAAACWVAYLLTRTQRPAKASAAESAAPGDGGRDAT